MRRALDEIQPHIVIAFGEAAIKEIHVEAQAHNFCHGRIVDNDGNLPPALKIIEGGAESLATQVDLLKIVNTLQQKNITCAVSHDAGSFLCNFLYYNLLLKEPVQGFHSLFVHIPVNWEASFSSVERFSDAAGKLLETVVAQALILERSCQ